MTGLTAYEFFCGGGMARIGLGSGWSCLLANDLDRAKCAAYRANFGGAELVEGDIHDLSPRDLPGQADLAWASFPCQDLSLAGARNGFGGRRSAAFWGFHRLIAALRGEGRAPRMLVIENVVGFASSRSGEDMALALSALAACGYRFDARIIDAADFLPQSRPRLFIIAWDEAAIAHRRGDADLSLTRYLDRLPGPARAAYFPLAFRKPPPSNAGLETIVDPSAPCFSAEETRKLLAMMTARQAAKLSAAREDAARQGAPVYGALFRRMRGGAQRAEARFDRAGCLRTPAGGSSRQILVIARPDGAVDMRRMTGREGARLMGLPDQYRLPASETQALKLAGDGVAVPVVRHIAETILEPMLRASLEPAAAAE